ncbi:hypothetical protein E2C01_068187 [Portunus trituberculatus]|uniref:Uncharacterized protein n=1 Tax=Portunus trituberculatus TaxID=210409 RepID=A0A5B7HX83_PORTR|nr:hypothetical protein [Portunus trituberculatus]
MQVLGKISNRGSDPLLCLISLHDDAGEEKKSIEDQVCSVLVRSLRESGVKVKCTGEIQVTMEEVVEEDNNSTNNKHEKNINKRV